MLIWSSLVSKLVNKGWVCSLCFLTFVRVKMLKLLLLSSVGSSWLYNNAFGKLYAGYSIRGRLLIRKAWLPGMFGWVSELKLAGLVGFLLKKSRIYNGYKCLCGRVWIIGIKIKTLNVLLCYLYALLVFSSKL